MESKYTYNADNGINDGTAIIIQECEGASALWTVTHSTVEIDADETGANPLEADGCWPEPPASVVAEARALLVDDLPSDVADTFRTWCAEGDRTEAEARQEIHEIAGDVCQLGPKATATLWQIWQETEVRS